MASKKPGAGNAPAPRVDEIECPGCGRIIALALRTWCPACKAWHCPKCGARVGA